MGRGVRRRGSQAAPGRQAGGRAWPRTRTATLLDCALLLAGPCCHCLLKYAVCSSSRTHGTARLQGSRYCGHDNCQQQPTRLPQSIFFSRPNAAEHSGHPRLNPSEAGWRKGG
eukprot:COSAG05_NODE_82_length_20915_cov_5.306399_1_plen_113_part_00